MIFAMCVGLYTSRILLQALGIEDYGIYNVVGGFVAMFALVSSALTGAISRFLTFELGRGNIKVLSNVFSTSIIVLLTLAVIIIILGESVGLWFLENKLVIPEARMYAANWVFQLGLLVFVVNLIVIPYNACIISHEKMDTFAYISIIEVVCKLLICLAVLYSPIDRLILYSLLLCLVSVTVALIYLFYCKHNFEECKFRFYLDRELLKKIFSFAGWSFIGSSGWILKNQGGTVLLNIFGGPIVNTANALACALSSAASNFVNCFTTSFTPQITKQYASEEYEPLHELILYSSKFSFFLLYIVALPIILNTHFVLYLWLGEVPEHSVNFVRLILLVALIDIISVPLVTLKNATGNIRNYQIVVGSIQLLSLPLAYIGLKSGACVEWLYLAYIVISILCLVARMYMLDDIPLWSLRKFVLSVCLRSLLVVLLSCVIPVITSITLPSGWCNLIITTMVSVISSISAIYIVGLDQIERHFILSKISGVISKIRQK